MSVLGFQSGSNKMTLSAPVRLTPTPPVRAVKSMMKIVSSLLKRSMRAWPARRIKTVSDCGRRGKRFSPLDRLSCTRFVGGIYVIRTFNVGIAVHMRTLIISTTRDKRVHTAFISLLRLSYMPGASTHGMPEKYVP